MIRHFKDITNKDIAIAGGKGASLGEMFNAGFPVPPGFVITAQAYEKFIDSVDLKDKIKEKLDGLDVENTDKLQIISHEIQKLILAAELPEELVKEIEKNYEEFGGFVAVRSSATAEDLPNASFAGQQSTFLNINGKEDVVNAVKECFASLFTARAIYYRERNNFDHMDVLIAVVIQQMIDSDKAGVIFTVNPVTNSREEMVIESAFGLGEAVVSGSLTPDSYIIDKQTKEVKEKHTSEQEWGFFKEDGKTIKKNIGYGKDESLNEDELKQLAEIAEKIEDHYGKPQDIEWAIKDKIYILQSRPVTTLK